MTNEPEIAAAAPMDWESESVASLFLQYNNNNNLLRASNATAGKGKVCSVGRIQFTLVWLVGWGDGYDRVCEWVLREYPQPTVPLKCCLISYCSCGLSKRANMDRKNVFVFCQIFQNSNKYWGHLISSVLFNPFVLH